jgi:GNAT superfamily N-acetyltransferase
MRTTISAHTVGTLTQHDKNAAVGALAAAFYADPVFEWLYPDAVNRRAVIGPFFEIFIDAIAPYGVSHLAGDGRGATLWVPPGESVVEEEEAEAFFDAINALSPDDVERLAAIFELMDAAHPSEPCWYLNFIGVVPEEQGTGVGSALLRASVARSDDDGVPAYLEATSPDNCRLYERFGFEVIGEIVLPDGPSMIPMWRDPARVTVVPSSQL